MMINLNLRDILKAIQKPKAIGVSLLINFLVVPLIAYLLGTLFLSNHPQLFVGLLLIALIPTSGMTASWTGLAGGSVQTALVMMVINLLVSLIAIPIYMNGLFGTVVSLPTAAILTSLVKVVVIPMVLASITRFIILRLRSEAYLQSLKPSLGGVSSLGVIAIVFVAIALKSSTIVNNLSLLVTIALPLLLFYLLIFATSQLLGRLVTDKKERIALVYSTGLRNLTIALGISLSSFGQSLAVLLIALAYIIQLPIASFYMKRLKQEEQEPPEIHLKKA